MTGILTGVALGVMVALLLLVPAFAHAQITSPINVDISNPSVADPSSIGSFIQGLYRSSLGLGALAAFVMITAGGVFYAVSGAINKKQEGIDIVKSAIFGLVILLGAFVILNTVNPQITLLKNPSANTVLSGVNYSALTGDYQCPDSFVTAAGNSFTLTNSVGVRTTKCGGDCTGDACVCKPAEIVYEAPFYIVLDDALSTLSSKENAKEEVRKYRDDHLSVRVALTASVPSEPYNDLIAHCLNGVPTMTGTYTYKDSSNTFYAICPNAPLQTALNNDKPNTLIDVWYTACDGNKKERELILENQCSGVLTKKQLLPALPGGCVPDFTMRSCRQINEAGENPTYVCDWTLTGMPDWIYD